MALTVHDKFLTATKDAYLRVIEVDYDASYPTGGEPLTADDLGFDDHATELTVVALATTVTSKYDDANAKLIAYYGDYNNANDGVGIEVANTTDLSAVTGVVLLVFGKKPNR